MGDNEFLKEMGQRIMVRRKSLRMTQEELAEKLGVSTQMISNLALVKNAIRPEILAKVCTVLELSADFILTGTNTKTAVDAVRDRNVDQAIFTGDRHGRFRAHFGQRVQARAASAAENQNDNVFLHW